MDSVWQLLGIENGGTHLIFFHALKTIRSVSRTLCAIFCDNEAFFGSQNNIKRHSELKVKDGPQMWLQNSPANCEISWPLICFIKTLPLGVKRSPIEGFPPPGSYVRKNVFLPFWIVKWFLSVLLYWAHGTSWKSRSGIQFFMFCQSRTRINQFLENFRLKFLLPLWWDVSLSLRTQWQQGDLLLHDCDQDMETAVKNK